MTVVATEPNEEVRPDPRLRAVVAALQGSLGAAGIECALLHETAGSLEEHDIDVTADGAWPDVWRAISEALGGLGYRALLKSEYDVGMSWYAVFASREGSQLRRVAIDVCGDPGGIAKFGVPMRYLLADAIERDGIKSPSLAWKATYIIAKHAWKRRASSEALGTALALGRSSPRRFAAAARRVFGRRLADGIVRRAMAEPTTRSIPNLAALLRAIHLRRAVRSPLLPLLFVRRWISRLMRPTGLWIVIAGPDGSGKSSLAAELADRVGPSFRRRLSLHWSPGILPRPGSLVGRDARDPERPHGSATHGPLVSALATLYHWLDHAIGYAARIRPTIVRSGLVVMERGFLDAAIDPRRYRLNGAAFAGTLGRLLPRPHLTILLLGDARVVHSRKPELSVNEIERQQNLWVGLRDRLGAVAIVDSGLSFDEVVAASLEAILARASERTAPDAGRP